MSFWDVIGGSLWFATHSTVYLYRVSLRRYRPLKLPLSCEVVQKVGFGPPICRGRDTPDFGHAVSNCTYFRPCGRFSLSSVQQARRLEGEKKKEERRKKESLVKYKSADNYVWRPKYDWWYYNINWCMYMLCHKHIIEQCSCFNLVSYGRMVLAFALDMYW